MKTFWKEIERIITAIRPHRVIRKPRCPLCKSTNLSNPATNVIWCRDCWSFALEEELKRKEA